MSGTSRSLQHAITRVFETWDPKLDWESDQLPPIKDLYSIIEAYIGKHNTTAAINSKPDDALRSTYNTFINESADILKDIFFVELLVRLLPVLNKEEVKSWLETYLRPALDSAGLDLHFVAKTRSLIQALTHEILPSPDPSLIVRREEIANTVMDKVCQVYLAEDQAAYDLLGSRLSQVLEDKHSSLERKRFIELNASAMLKEWGLKKPKSFFTLIHKYFVVTTHRPKILLLASKLVSVSPALPPMSEAPFLNDLLQCLCFDESPSILGAAINVLLMMLCKIHEDLPAYLPEVLAVYCRLSTWDYMKGVQSPHQLDWEVMYSLQSEPVMDSQVFLDGEFRLLFYLTLLYGLFPGNLLALCNNVEMYTKANSPQRHAAVSYIFHALCDSPEALLSFSWKTTTKLQRFMLHPNVLSKVTAEDEIKHPFRWLHDKRGGGNLEHDNILLKCCELNPEIIFTIPDGVIIPDRLLQKVQCSSSLGSEFPQRKSVISKNAGIFVDKSFPGSSRSSFQLTADSLNDGLQPSLDFLPAYWLNMERRVSIIPTRLVLESKNASPINDNEPIKFRSVDFDGSSINSESTYREDKLKKRDQLTDLYTEHEKLFTNSDYPTTNINVSADSSQITQVASSDAETVSDLLTKQLKSEGNGKTVKEADVARDDTHTFYQRELLLMKNEMEFASYMKHLNKVNYIRLKLQYNGLIKQKGPPNHPSKTIASTFDPTSTVSSADLQKLKSHYELEATRHKTELETLSEKVCELQKHIQLLQLSLDELTVGKQRGETQIRDLEHMLRVSEAECASLRNALKLKSAAPQVPNKVPDRTITPSPSPLTPFVSNAEKENLSHSFEVQALMKQNEDLRRQQQSMLEELGLAEKKYQNSLSNEKLGLSEALREQSSHYERKIKELNAVMLRYEAASREAQSRAIQLEKTKPIRIVSGDNSTSRTGWDMPDQSQPMLFKYGIESGRFHHGNGFDVGMQHAEGRSSENSLEVVSLSSASKAAPKKPTPYPFIAPSRPTSNTSLPIIKGRGGYQKRAKKTM